jgi:hypothetical protein
MMGNTMTAARRRQKSLWPAGLAAGWVAAGLLLGLPGCLGVNPALAAGQIVADDKTGLAINGFDPVAYFTDGTSRLGLGTFEYNFGGAVWRFRNVGNRFAFMNDPDVYQPKFGGYDPLALVRGVAIPGDPRNWIISGSRLYLFRTPEARDAFAAVAEQIVPIAEERWPAVQRSLLP